jgi:hypothetical protein
MREFLRKNKNIFLFVFLVFMAWQLVIAGVIFFGEKFLPSSLQYVYTEQGAIINPVFLWSRANFDGTHYLDIAKKGYGIYQQALFPLYPKLISLLVPFFGERDLITGWSISLVSFILGLVVFVKLVKLDYEESVARRTIIFLLFFPTAFFFSMVYTESLFLFLILVCFYFARVKKWWLAGVFGVLASATRLTGIFLFPALLIEWWEQRKQWNNGAMKQWSNLLAIGLIPLGLLYYMRYLAIQYHDPLMFLHVQPFFGAERTTKVILLYQVFWRYLKMLWTVDRQTLTYFVVVLEFLVGIGFLGLLFLGYRRKIRLSYLIFAILAYLVPTLTGTFSSLPRYALTLFPCFIIMGLIENRVIRYLLLVVSSLLLIICTILFSQGYWIA